MKAIDNKELILALEELEKEKGIKKEYVLESIEANITNIGLLAKEGMRETDKEILTIMTGK